MTRLPLYIVKHVTLLLLLLILITPVETQEPVNTTRNWSTIADNVWERYKLNYISCGIDCADNLGLVFDPLSDYHAVSEGVGYGMLLAVLFDDQPTFEKIYHAAEVALRDEETGLHHWRADKTGTVVGFGSATDAEFDIAMALIFASQKVESGQWGESLLFDYDQEARRLLDATWQYAIVDATYIKPGNLFSGDGSDIINLSYFSPAWFRLFDQFLGEVKWTQLIDPGYEMLNATHGSPLGLAPDWSTAEGDPAYDYCDRYGRSRESCRYEMFYDAIRVLWRIGLDCLWFDDTRACDWMQRGTNFQNQLDAPDFARMYDMQGKVIVDYRDESMLSMWLFAAIANGDEPLQHRLEWDLYNFATTNTASSFLSEREPYYYNQSLTLFVISYLSNYYSNLFRNNI